MKSNVKCSRLRLVGLGIVTSLLGACATASSESVVGVCPPVVEYDQAEQAQAADEIASLSNESAVVEMLSEYAVMRKQAGSCLMP
jgi:hypothetical protein